MEAPNGGCLAVLVPDDIAGGENNIVLSEHTWVGCSVEAAVNENFELLNVFRYLLGFTVPSSDQT